MLKRAMAVLPFTKMHGCGNDYIYLDGWWNPLPPRLGALARTLSDRHRGIGADGLIVIARSRRADLRMIMYNADGSRSEMCGNGLRCAAKLAWDHGHIDKRTMRVETGAGVLEVALAFAGGQTADEVVGASVRMGRPRLEPGLVPVRLPGPGPLLRLPLTLGSRQFDATAVGMGNPHAVCFVRDAERVPLAEWGPLVEHDRRFPRRTNVEFVSRLPDEGGVPVLRQRTWERGSGITMACGTGACAAVVAAILRRRIAGRRALVRLDGGDLEIGWAADDAEVVMSGPAVTAFTGRCQVAGAQTAPKRRSRA
jgi:diaminopimelate epimerase